MGAIASGLSGVLSALAFHHATANSYVIAGERAARAMERNRIAALPRYTYDEPFVPPVPKGGE